jgi:hypothetical protein
VRVKLAVTGATTLVVIALALSVAGASAAVPFCPSPGSGPGQCNGPKGLATDWETGRVYVVDNGNHRVNVFQSDGTFLSSFGAAELHNPTGVAVDNNETSPSHHNVYVTDGVEVRKFKASGEFIKSFGGEAPCELMSTQDPIAVGPGGTVDVADRYDKDGPGPFEVSVNRLLQFDAEGGCLDEVKLFESANEFIRTLDLAVDSLGDLYISVLDGSGLIRKYSPTGILITTLPGVQTEGLSIDAADNLFAKQKGQALTKVASTYFITEYTSDVVVKRFGYLPGLRAGTSLAALELPGGEEGVFATEGSAGVNFLPIPKGPVIVPEACHVKPGGLGSVRATLQAEVNPEGKATKFRAEYLTLAKFEEGKDFEKTAPFSLEGGASDVDLHEAAPLVEGLTPETKYRCRIVAENADGTTLPGQEGEFITKEGFEFGPTFVTNVGEEEATLNAEGNPLGLQATAEVEYVTDAQFKEDRFTQASHSPPPELDYGAGEALVLKSLTLTGLQPATTYHWRLHVKNGVPPEGIFCPKNAEEPCPANENEHEFRTYGPEAPPDNRGYELVSPAQKNSAEVATPIVAAGIFEDRNMLIQVSSGSGESATYTSFTSFGKDAEGAPSASQYLSKRGPTGWTTENISPFGFQQPILSIPFKGFDPELGRSVFKVSSGALAPGCPEGVENLYLRDSATGALTCLTPEVPQATAFSCLNYAGSSEDGSRVFFASGSSYAGAPSGDGFNLYEWSAAGGLKAISILPGQSTLTAPNQATSFGPSLNPDNPEATSNCQFGQTVMRHVVSADGSKAFWTYVPENTAEPTQLLAHVDGAETVQLDTKQSGSGTSGNGVFVAASKDGSVVYFTSPNKLVAGAQAKPGAPDLYRYDFNKAVDKRLTDVTQKGSIVADVQGVVGASDDGSSIYFVAKGALTGEEEGAGEEKAEQGALNLYLSHEGQPRFIARLSVEDSRDWEAQPKNLSARVSADGRHLAFLSHEAPALAEYDNTIAKGQHCQQDIKEKALFGGPICTQAFLYDAENKALSCVSCNPTGERPLGPTGLPGWSNVYEGPRYLSDDGSRFFFESFDALSRDDVNGLRDVYEFERPGTGSCTTASGTFDPKSGGCHFLISSGTAPSESYLLDGSSNGRDVFFSTREKMVGRDTNENFDVYDYREGGGFAEPVEPVICVGEAGCKPPVSVPPAPASPATPTFTGPENPKPKKPKPHHKKKHKQKKNKKQHKKKSQSKKAGRR